MRSRSRILSKHLLVLLFALMLVLPSPMLVSEADAATNMETKVDIRLMEYIEGKQSSDLIPIVLQFPEGTSESEMQQALESIDVDLTVRHVFHMIPYVSGYVFKANIQEIASSSQVQGILLDVWRNIPDLSTENTFVLADGELGYEHFTEILDVDGLWDQGYYGNNTVVAIIDSGVDGTHPDIQQSLIGFKDYVGSGTDMNPSDGIDSYDDNGHGTACAWNVVGSGLLNGGNLTGVAPGASLLAVKVLDASGGADESLIAESMEWAADNGVANADILSLSIGGEWIDSEFLIEPSAAMAKELTSHGVSVVIAGGNSGPAPFTMNSPGIVDEAITVGSSAGSAGIVAFSSRGPVYRSVSEPTGYYAKPDIIAPGYFVVSGRGEEADPNEFSVYNYTQFDDAYTSWSGTSSSAPQIAGLVALLLDKYETLTPLQAKIALMQGATDLGADPMEQGYGLANVTRADEILDESLTSMTIMAPRKYPTLPGTSNVLIAGDDRPDQNVTVMSSQSLGVVDIIKSGNATQFVTVSQETVSIEVGYSYFGIGLEIPEDLPLTAIGRYTGELVLAMDSINITSIDLDLVVTTYGGKMLIDMAHHDDDLDDPSAYRYFTGYLREHGVIVDTFGNSVAYDTATIDSGDLAGAEIFTIMDTELPYSESEIDALHQFVTDGGVLIMLSEFYDEATDTASFGIDSYNEILEPFGIQCERIGIGVGPTDSTGQFYGEDHGGAVETDSLMEEVRNLYVLSGSTLNVDPAVAGAKGLFWIDAEKEHALVATAEYGNGRIIVISDGSTLYDDILYDAIRGGADNLKMLRNIASSIVPSTPRIFDVEIATRGIGENANFTAFVFDDDLAEVTMSILAPDGTQIVGTVKETLGYKFSTSFILQSGGFYDVLITASDSEENVRIFHKIFLIPLDPIDDQFITTVTWTLLGITGVALLYVGLNKMGIHRRPREPKQQEYWEDGTPPTIS